MNKDEFIKIVNVMIDARIKKLLPALLKKEMSKIKEELSEGTFALPDDINIREILKEDAIISKRQARAEERASSLVSLSPKQPPQRQFKPITTTFSKDPALNRILQQTAEEIRSGKTKPASDASSVEQYKQILAEQYVQAQEAGEDMETFTFDTSRIPDLASMKSNMRPSKPISNEIEKKIALEVGKQQIAAMTGNEELGNVMIRDYRSFMKKVDEKDKPRKR